MERPDLTDIDHWLKKGIYLKETLRLVESEFIDDLFDRHFRDSKFQKLYRYKEGLDCIVANLIFAGITNKPLSRPNPDYFKLDWMKKTIVKNILDTLVENEYAINYNGYYNVKNPKLSQSAKYYPTQKLIDLQLNIKHEPFKELIRLFNKAKKQVSYVKTPMIKKWIKNLEDINKVITNSTIKYKYEEDELSGYIQLLNYLIQAKHIRVVGENKYEINKNSSFVYRSFARNSFTMGGRFYTQVFQLIPSKWRKTITIDDEETIELDYEAHHIRMLYNMKGIDFKGLPYIYAKDDLVNKDKREINKLIVMIAINAPNQENAIHAVLNSIKEEKKVGKFKSELPNIDELRKLYYDFLNYHKPIAEYVGADIGVKLQRKDSDIMNDVLVELSKLNIVGLGVHDSIIVKKKHKETLENIMLNSYKKVMKFNTNIG